MNPLIAVRDLQVSFAADEGTVEAVRGVSFDIAANRTTAVVNCPLPGFGLKGRTGLGLRGGRPGAQVFGPPLAAPAVPERGEVRAGHHAAPAPKRTVRPSAHSSKEGV